MTIEAVTEVQANLHDMLQAIPVLEVNIEHSSRQHRAIVKAILAGDADQGAPRDGAALRRHRRAPARSARLTRHSTDGRDAHDPQRPPPDAWTSSRPRIERGEIDTVVVAFTDMQGRLQGKRLHGATSSTSSLGHGTEGCNYLLGVDVDMNTVDGYAITSWDRGYGDMEFVLDLDTIRLLPTCRRRRWCSATWSGRTTQPVVQSPRTILKRADGPRRRARLRRPRRHRAGVHRLQRHLRGGATTSATAT